MARGRLRCLGTSLRLKARFGSGYRVSIRVQGSSAGTANVEGSGSSSAEGSAAGALGSGSSLVGAGLAHEDSDLEIQPAPLAVQPGLHPAAPPQRSGSNHSGRSGSGEPAEQAQQRDPAAARQAAGIKSLFLKQLGIKPGGCCWEDGASGLGPALDASCVCARSPLAFAPVAAPPGDTCAVLHAILYFSGREP